MPPTVQVGTILIEEQPLIAQVLGLESEPYSGNWGVVKAFDSFALDRKIHPAGWNFFFMAAEVKVMFFGALGAKNIQNALKRILGKVRHQNFNPGIADGNLTQICERAKYKLIGGSADLT